MPVTEHFTSLGKGNGFPECLAKTNVSVFDYWTTFSGVNKDNPATSDELIAASYRHAMNIYWNVFSCSASCSATFIDNGVSPLPSESSSITDIDTSEHSKTKPESRVCGFASGSESVSSLPSGRTNCFLSITAFMPVKLYNGVTTDEGNFVGYGLNTSSIVNSRAVASNRAVARISLLSHGDASASTGTFDYAYVDLDGVHFLCEARALGDVESPDATNLTSSATASVSSNDYTADSSFTSFDEFYTYP